MLIVKIIITIMLLACGIGVNILCVKMYIRNRKMLKWYKEQKIESDAFWIDKIKKAKEFNEYMDREIARVKRRLQEYPHES